MKDDCDPTERAHPRLRRSAVPSDAAGGDGADGKPAWRQRHADDRGLLASSARVRPGHARSRLLGSSSPETWASRWSASLVDSLIAVDVDSWTDYHDEMWTLAATYRAGGGKLGMLSNGVPEIVARIRADRDIDQFFDAIVISFEVQLAKPEPEIYRVTLDRLGVPPSTRSSSTTAPRTSRPPANWGCERCISPATSTHSGPSSWPDGEFRSSRGSRSSGSSPKFTKPIGSTSSKGFPDEPP